MTPDWLHGALASVPVGAALAVYCQRPRDGTGWRVVVDIPSRTSPIILASEIKDEATARAILRAIINEGTS